MHSGSVRKRGIAAKGLPVLLWALAIWLLLPLHRALTGPGDFVRVCAGIFLVIIFSTKLLYDTIIERRYRSEDPIREFLHVLGLIVVIVLVVGFVVLAIGLLVANVLRPMATS